MRPSNPPVSASSECRGGNVTNRETINARNAPAPRGGYSQAVKIEDFRTLVFISGQIPVSDDDKVPEGFEDQARLVWRNIDAQLKAAADAFLVSRALTSHARELSTGDLAEMKKRGSIRMLTRNNAVSYFLYKGTQQGFDYELLKMFAKEQGLRLDVVVPPDASDLIPWLLEGKGDGGLTSAERAELAQLRRENRKLKEERDILSKAAAWFANEKIATPKRSSGS